MNNEADKAGQLIEILEAKRIALSNQSYRYKVKCFIERMRLLGRSDSVIKKAVKNKYNIILTD